MRNDLIYDSIFLEFVPKIVDQNPEKIREIQKDAKYWDYANKQVHEFWERLFADCQGRKLLEQRFQEEKAAIFRCEGSPYDLTIGFKPGYHLLIVSPDDKRQVFTGKDCLACPTFDVSFKTLGERGTRAILQAGLEQFFLKQADIEEGTLAAIGGKDGEVVHRDLQLLRAFLPIGTTIEARCNYGAGNGRATYRL